MLATSSSTSASVWRFTLGATVAGAPRFCWACGAGAIAAAAAAGFCRFGAGAVETSIVMEALGRALVQRLKGSLIEGVYSRAVLDLNRRATDWDMAGAVLDGVEVPRNVDLSPASYAARIQSIHTPYHDEIERFLAEDPGHPDRVIIHCHSFTDCLMSQPDQPRPWEIGLLHYNATDRAAEALDWLRANTDYTVGDNEPYSLFERMTGSYALHSLHRDAPAITVESRQDLLPTPSHISHWCAVLEAMIKEVF